MCPRDPKEMLDLASVHQFTFQASDFFLGVITNLYDILCLCVNQKPGLSVCGRVYVRSCFYIDFATY